MKSESSSGSTVDRNASDARSRQIRAAQVQLLYRQRPLGLLGALILVAAMTAVFWNQAPQPILVVWLGCSCVFYLARYWLVLAFRSASPEGEAAIPWGTWSALGGLINGLLWGAFAVIIFPEVSLTYQTVLCFFLSAIALGGVTVNFPRREAYVAGIMTAGLPLAGILLYQGGSVHLAMGSMILVYTIVLIIAGNRMNHALTVSLNLGFENQDLIRSLSGEKEETKRLNASLREQITERKQAEETLRLSEERFKELVELLPALVYEFDENGKFTFLNRSGLELGGYTEEDLRSGLITLEAALAGDLERALHNLRRVLSGEKLSGEQYTLRRKDGRDALIESWSVPILRGETVVGVRGVGVDITERIRAEEQIKASLEEKEILLREIHHRVKNNLAVIIALLSLHSRFAGNEVKEVLVNVQNRIRAMVIAHEKLYRSENLATLNVDEYVTSLLEHLFAAYGALASGITAKEEVEQISLALDTAIPFGMILTELVSNCLKHAYPEGCEGEIKVCIRAVGQEEYELAVSDNGVGMPDDLDWKKPESFGLRLVKALVGQLNGKIEIAGEDGTEVRIRFRESRKSPRFDGK